MVCLVRRHRNKEAAHATAMEVPTLDAVRVDMASVVTAVPLLEAPRSAADGDGAQRKHKMDAHQRSGGGSWETQKKPKYCLLLL